MSNSGVHAKEVLVLASAVLIVLATISVPGNSHASKGIMVTVKTDKHHYSLGDTVKITVTVLGLDKLVAGKGINNNPVNNAVISVKLSNGVTTKEVADSEHAQDQGSGVLVISYTLPASISSTSSSESGATEILYSVVAHVFVPGYELAVASTTFTAE